MKLVDGPPALSSLEPDAVPLEDPLHLQEMRRLPSKRRGLPRAVTHHLDEASCLQTTKKSRNILSMESLLASQLLLVEDIRSGLRNPRDQPEGGPLVAREDGNNVSDLVPVHQLRTDGTHMRVSGRSVKVRNRKDTFYTCDS